MGTVGRRTVSFHPPRRIVAYGSGSGRAATVFFFFSNRIGCLGSILVSVLLTVVLLLVFGVL
jgi:hypothetical protein